MRALFTLALVALAFFGHAQESDSLLYAMAIDRSDKGTNRDRHYWVESDSMLTVLIDRGGDEWKYYHARGVMRLKIAEARNADEFFFSKDTALASLFERGAADLIKAIDLMKERGDNPDTYYQRSWLMKLENNIRSMQRTAAKIRE